MSSPFKIIDLPNSTWAVSWSEQLTQITTTPVRLMPTGKQVLDIVFKEMKLFEARLGILLNNKELETLRVDADAYYQNPHRLSATMSMYVVAGVVFDTEIQSQKFLQIVEKQYIMNLLKESA
jgi:hypothetical protein